MNTVLFKVCKNVVIVLDWPIGDEWLSVCTVVPTFKSDSKQINTEFNKGAPHTF